MRLKTFAFALAATGVAASLYARARRRHAPAHAPEPETSERLQGSDASALPTQAAVSDELFGSNSQRGPYPEATGLPDFSRGA
ncbi:MAG: hypothetical protein AB1430_17475 [Pseudomonadota bacterium]